MNILQDISYFILKYNKIFRQIFTFSKNYLKLFLILSRKLLIDYSYSTSIRVVHVPWL